MSKPQYDISAYIGIKTDLELPELAQLISAKLCGGIPFEPDTDGIRDEVPAYVSRQFLGMGMVLHGFDGDYGLDLYSWDDDLASDAIDIDFACNLRRCIDAIDGLTTYEGYCDQ